MSTNLIPAHSQQGFTKVPNITARDINLRPATKGHLVQMLSLPAGWDYSAIGMSRNSNDGSRAWRTSFTELAKAGYLFRYYETRGKGKIHTRCVVDNVPHPEWVRYDVFLNPKVKVPLGVIRSALKRTAVESEFIRVSHEAAKSNDLTASTKGHLVEVLSHSESWNISPGVMCQKSRGSIASWRKAYAQLIDTNYMIRGRGKGGRGRKTVYAVSGVARPDWEGRDDWRNKKSGESPGSWSEYSTSSVGSENLSSPSQSLFQEVVLRDTWTKLFVRSLLDHTLKKKDKITKKDMSSRSVMALVVEMEGKSAQELAVFGRVVGAEYKKVKLRDIEHRKLVARGAVPAGGYKFRTKELLAAVKMIAREGAKQATRESREFHRRNSKVVDEKPSNFDEFMMVWGG